MPVRWSSTYTMLKMFYGMMDAIKAVLATQKFDRSLDSVALTSQDWVIAQELLLFFGIFTKTTTLMQADNYPTINRILPEYYRLIKDLELVTKAEAFGSTKTLILQQSIRDAATSALAKMNDYFTRNTSSPTAFVATICDPRFKLTVFESLWKDDRPYVERAKRHFKNVYN